MRCQLSSVKCCCLHLSHDASSPGLCVLHLSSADLYICYLLKSLSDLISLSSYSYGHLFLFDISSDGSFGCTSSCLTLQDIIELNAKRQRSCRSAYVTFTSSISFPPSPIFFFFLPLLTSSSLVILSQWTSGTDGKRRSWTLVPLSHLTHLGHRSTSALTSHPSALTKSRLRWLPAAVNFSGSHGVCLWAKCPLESKPGCLYGGRHLFLETMSKYKSAQDTTTTLIRNKFMNKMCAESHVYWNIYLTQNLIEIIYFRFPFISFLHLIKVLNQTQPSPDFCLLFVFRRQCIFLDKLQLNYNLKGWHLAEILLVHVILSNSMHSFASKHKMWNTSEENYSAHACITKSCW